MKLDKEGKKPSRLIGLFKFGVFVLLCLAVYIWVPYGGQILVGLCVTVVLLIFCIIGKVAQMNPSQKKAAQGVVGDWRHCCAGKELEIGRKDETTSDVIIPRAWVNASGKIDPVKPVSLRRSVDMTITAEFKNGSKHAEEIGKDDPNKPMFHVHGWSKIVDLSTADEFWTSYPHYPSMPACYAWQERISGGLFSPVVGVDPEQEDVLGHIYLLALDKSFYEKGDRIYRITKGYNQMNADVTDPEANGKVLARFGYKASLQMGNYVPEHADSFIFRGDLIRESGLKVLHTYRIVVPPRQAGASADSSHSTPLLA